MMKIPSSLLYCLSPRFHSQIIILIISYSYLGETTRVCWKYFDLISSRIDLLCLRIVSRLRTPERLGRQPTCCLRYCEHLQSYWQIDLLNYSTLHFFLLKWSFLIFPRIFLEREIWQLFRKLYLVSSYLVLTHEANDDFPMTSLLTYFPLWLT